MNYLAFDLSLSNEYKKLLDSKNNFAFVYFANKTFVLTKEYSIFEIENQENFIKKFEENIFYKSVYDNPSVVKVSKEDEDLFYNTIEKYKSDFTPNLETGIIFGCVAVRLGNTNSFIVTSRGKKDLKSYSIVKSVDDINHIIHLEGDNKASLNAPLLADLFKVPNVKTIVHLHKSDKMLVTFPYEFPGTVADSRRLQYGRTFSFNIEHHGLVYLFDENGKLIR